MGQSIVGAPQMFGRGTVVDPTIAAIPSANILVVTDILTRITGNTVIKTIAAPNAYFNGPIYLLNTDVGGGSWDATGNIAVAGVLTRNIVFAFLFDPAVQKWYPSAVA